MLEGRGEGVGEKNQYKTKQWLTGLGVRRAEKVTAIHYVWWPANGQCACRQMDCKRLPCVSIGRVARGAVRTRANTR